MDDEEHIEERVAIVRFLRAVDFPVNPDEYRNIISHIERGTHLKSDPFEP